MKTIGRLWHSIFNITNVVCDWTDELKNESDMARHAINSDRTDRLKTLGITRNEKGELTFPIIPALTTAD